MPESLWEMCHFGDFLFAFVPVVYQQFVVFVFIVFLCLVSAHEVSFCSCIPVCVVSLTLCHDTMPETHNQHMPTG